MEVASFHSGLDIKRGSSLAFMNIAIALKERGHQVSVWSFAVDEWYRNRLDEAGIPAISMDHHHLSPMGISMILTNNRRARRAFGRLRREFENADVSYLHGNQWTPLALPMLDMPRAYYCDEPPRHYYEPDLVNVTPRKRLGKAMGYVSRRIDKAADRKAVVTADAVATNSDYTRGYIERVYGLQATTVYLGVDHQLFSPDPAEEEEDVVVSVGALYPLKAHDFIIRSLARVDKTVRPGLLLVGKGDQRAQLEAMATSLGVRMEVVSEIDTPRLARIYRRAKLTLVAHVREPFGLVAIESQSCGTPVVAVGEAGLRETVTPETGVLTRRDEGEFAIAVEELLRDGPRRAEMGKHGRARVIEMFNWAKTGVDMERVLEMATGQREGRGGT